MADLPVYTIPGERVTSLESFWTAMGEAINGPGSYFGTNLDAFADCLSGGFGTPDGCYIIRWSHAEDSRRALGYAETVRQLEARLRHAHPSNHADIRGRLGRARRNEGPTVFDWLIEIIQEADNVELVLD